MDRLIISGIDGPDGLKALAADFDRAARVAPVRSRQVVQKGCLNIKTDWRAAWSGHAHAPALPNAVTYDTSQVGDRVVGEVGPEVEKRQGDLGNLFEFGSVNNAPIPGGAPALERERPRFERAMQDLAVDALEQRR